MTDGRLLPPENPPEDQQLVWVWLRQAHYHALQAGDSVARVKRDIDRLQGDVASAISGSMEAESTIKTLGERVKTLETVYQRGMGIWIAIGVIGPLVGSIIGGLILYKLTGKP